MPFAEVPLQVAEVPLLLCMSEAIDRLPVAAPDAVSQQPGLGVRLRDLTRSVA